MKNRLAITVALILAGSAFAGCVGGDDDPVTPGSTNNGNGGNGGDGQYPPAIVRTPLATALAASAEWVTPSDEVTFTATPPADATGDVTYSWSYGELPEGWGKAAEGDDPHAGHGDDAAEGGHEHGGEAETIDTGDIAPGAYADALAFADEGEFLFHCHPHPWMKFNLRVRDGAGDAGTFHVAIIEDDAGDIDTYRFAPAELEVAPGSEIVFWNNGTMMHTATLESKAPVLKPIEATGASITFNPGTDGDYRVVVTVKDAETGYGTAEARVLVDSSKPDAETVFGPYTGEYMGSLAGNSQPAPTEHNFVLEYDATTLTVDYTVSDATGAGTGVLGLYAKGSDTPIVESADGASGTITAENLAAGQYFVKVTPTSGLQMTYEATVTAQLDLVPPAPGEAGGHGGHAH